jgi:phage recombination protein Bet
MWRGRAGFEENNVNAVMIPNKSNSVLVRLGSRFGVDPDKMLGTLQATVFKGNVSTEQMMMLLVVADQFNLNPFTKEIYAFPDRNNGIVPIVGVDGWSRIINENPQFDGMEFSEGPLNSKSIPEYIECKMFRKDRSHAVAVKEFFDEVFRDVGPWKTHPRRMLRHKAMIQCARVAFGFVGIFDEDEAERIREEINITPAKIDPRGDLTEVDYALRDKHVAEIAKLIDEFGSDDAALAPKLKDYVTTHLAGFQELQITVWDKLAADGTATKGYLRKLMQ